MLEQKVWYRSIKVLYTTGIILGLLISICLGSEMARSKWPKNTKYVICSNGREAMMNEVYRYHYPISESDTYRLWCGIRQSSIDNTRDSDPLLADKTDLEIFGLKVTKASSKSINEALERIKNEFPEGFKIETKKEGSFYGSFSVFLAYAGICFALILIILSLIKRGIVYIIAGKNRE